MNTSLLNQLLTPITPAHASHQRCNNGCNHDDDGDSSSHFQTTVCLYDWWLIKADKDYEGKRLAVAGFTSRKLQAMRPFTSAPIVKRYDVFTLETADGICIVLKGFLNKLRVRENEFAAEIFSHFLFGFPPYWEVYNEKCLEEEFTSGPGLATVPDINSSATEHEFAAVVGMTNANPSTATINYKVNGKNKHTVEDKYDCSENVSEKVATNASKGSDWLNQAAEANNIGKAKDHTSENLLPSMNCDINAVNLPKENIQLLSELSSYNLTGSSERMANSKSSDKGSNMTVPKSKTLEPASLESLTISNASLGECAITKASTVKNNNSSNLVPTMPMGDSSRDLRTTSRKCKAREPACFESITISNAALGECSIPKASDFENLNSSNLDPAVPVENPSVNLRITSSRPKNSEQQEENDGSDDRVICRNKNCSTFSLPQEFVATVRCAGEKSNGVKGSGFSSFGLGVTQTESLSTSPINEDSDYQALSGNCVGDTMNCPAVESVTNVNGFTPTKVHTDAINITTSNSGGRKISDSLRNQNKHTSFRDYLKCKSKELISETSKHLNEENLKRCSSGTTIHSGKKIDMSEAARCQSINRTVRNILGNSKGKEKEEVKVVCVLKSKRNEMGSAALVPNRTGNLEDMNIFDFCGDELQQPSHDTGVKDNSKQGQDCRKQSQTSTPRQKPNNSEGSCNEFGDTNHKCESETVGEKKVDAKRVSSSKKKARRKINFDTNAYSENIVSPESLSLKRSRSGRLLLPSLDFWRNQIAVYDADRKITGIQVATPSKGSKSELTKRQRRR